MAIADNLQSIITLIHQLERLKHLIMLQAFQLDRRETLLMISN